MLFAAESSPVPIYLPIVNQVRAAVAGGDLRPGGALPSVRQLALDLRVNPITASLRFGAPGAAAAEHLGARQGWSATADAPPDLLLSMTAPLPELSASLRAYVRERYGDRRFAALWRSDAPFGEAVQRELEFRRRSW